MSEAAHSIPAEAANSTPARGPELPSTAVAMPAAITAATNAARVTDS